LRIHNNLRQKTKLTREVNLKFKRENQDIMKAINSMQDEDEDIDFLIAEYWRKLWEKTQDQRWSEESKEAFNTMRRLTKYNQFEKRDGSIVSKIQISDQEVITDIEKVEEIIITQLKKIQTLESEPKYDHELQFPKLPRLEGTYDTNEDVEDNSETNQIMMRMSVNKAIAYDGMSDKVFRIKGASGVLASLWDYDFPDPVYHETKLVALNKLHPKIPGPKDFRPINVMPQGVKFKETRFASKLYDYMEYKMHPSQTGFVPKIGCLVNQARAVDRIKKRTENPNGTRVVYGVFIDFSSAYNTILHSKLFKRLKNILSKKEIQYLKALYSRNVVKLGDHSFKPNIGVAQGSIISPALFDIYSEDLLKKIEAAGIDKEDILAYADDILILCTSLNQIRMVIKLIREWSNENNLHLNEKKSGIVPFQSRYGKDQSEFALFEEKKVADKKTGKIKTIKIPKQLKFEGFPVVHKYKYLGLWLSYRLELGYQLNHIKQKVNFIGSKLYHMLKQCSLETRTNLWELMCRPLLEQAFILFETEQSVSNKEALLCTARNTFRRMTLLAKNVEVDTINKFMRYDFIQHSSDAVRKARRKWNIRVKRENLSLEEEIKFEEEEKKEGKSKKKEKNLMPKELVDFTNLLTAKCTKCKGKIARASHFLNDHGLDIPEPIVMWTKLEEMTIHRIRRIRGKKKKLVNRKETIKKRGSYVQNYINQIVNLLSDVNMSLNSQTKTK
jgi:hypothetical protein